MSNVRFNFSYPQPAEIAPNFRWRVFIVCAQRAAYYRTAVVRNLVITSTKLLSTITSVDRVRANIADSLTIGQAIKYANNAI